MQLSHIFFDINETLIDIAPLREAIAARLGNTDGAGKRWFDAVINYSHAETLMGSHTEFSDVAAAVLVMLGSERGDHISLEEAKQLVGEGLTASEPWPDVPQSLERLQEAGFKTVALTNSDEEGLETRLADAGLAKNFNAMLSVRASGAFKPDARCYRYGLEKMGVAPDRSLMIACHPWDLIGAQCVGMTAGFVEMPGSAWYPLADEPALSAKSLSDLIDQIVIGEN
jgi:2-haloacid dehalogenase